MSELEDRRRRFELLYGENHGAVLGYLLRRTESPEDAADVIADVFLTAWRRLDDVPPGEQTRLWLFGVARRALANHHRGQRAEFAAHDLNVRLHLVPASPSLVGTLVFFSYLSRNGSGKEIQPITAVGRCSTGGGGPVCPVGVRIPIGYRGSADITFGRAARSGELYASTTNADAQGEAMHGLRFRGRTVAAVLAMLRARHVTVPQYRAQKTNSSDVVPPDRVPDSWHVYDAVPWAPGQVLLFVGPAASPSAGAP